MQEVLVQQKAPSDEEAGSALAETEGEIIQIIPKGYQLINNRQKSHLRWNSTGDIALWAYIIFM